MPICGSWPRAGPKPTSGESPSRRGLLAIDAYDNCLAYLDERLGELIDDLERRGVLDQTLVIVTADHGEGLGEHGLFDHGESLYRPEIRVPLLVRLARGPRPIARAPSTELVSLRDIATTIADFVRPGDEVAVPGPIVAPARAHGRDARRQRRAATMTARRVLRAGVAQSVRSEPRPVPRLSRPAWSPWPKGISSTFAMKATGARNYSTSATTPTSSSILPAPMPSSRS